MFKTIRYRIKERIGDTLLARCRRREFVAGADPTQVVEYTYPRPRGLYAPSRVSVDLIASWGIESRVWVFGREFRTYDHGFWSWVFNLMEDAHCRATYGYSDDGPMPRYM
jgi:hypothetical protein